MVGYTHVEVRKYPVEGKKWWVIAYGKNGATVANNIVAKTRFKRDAVLVAQGVAKVLLVELRVTNRKGQYTKDAASYGNDPSNIPG